MIFLLVTLRLLVVGSVVIYAQSERLRRLRKDSVSSRHGLLEQFSHSCLKTIAQLDSPLTQFDYARFLGDFCIQSPYKGPACPSSEKVLFSSLPVDVQLLFVDCRSEELAQEIDCLQYLIDKNEPILYDRPLEILCAKTFTVLKSSQMLAVESEPARQSTTELNQSAMVAATSNAQPRGVGNGQANLSPTLWADDDKPKAEKENKLKGSSPKASPSMPPSASPFTQTPDSLIETKPPSVPDPLASQQAPTVEPTAIQVDSVSLSSGRYDENDPQASDSVPVLIGVVAIGFLLIAFATLKVSKHRRRSIPNSGYAAGKGDVVFSGDASILSEPSQLFDFETNNNPSSDEADSRPSKKRWFRNMFAAHDLLQQNTVPLRPVWKKNDPKSLATDEKVKNISSTSSQFSSNGDYPFFDEGTECKRNENNNPDIPEAYHLDIYPVEDKVSSSLSSGSPPGYKTSIDALFRKRGSLFSGSKANKAQVCNRGEGDTINRENSISPEPTGQPCPSREARHENDILELEGAADFRNVKPWLRERIHSLEASYPLESEAPTIDDIETSFLSPDIAQQFREVDQCLADGLRQVREEDHKLGLGVEKYQASMSSRKAARGLAPDTTSETQKKYDATLTSKSREEAEAQENDDGDNGNKAFTEYTNARQSTSGNEGDIDNAALIRNDLAATPQRTDQKLPWKQVPSYDRGQHVTDSENDEDEEDDACCKDERWCTPFAPTWIHREQAEAWDASRSALSLPRHTFFDDVQQKAALLPPRLGSMDSTEGD